MRRVNIMIEVSDRLYDEVVEPYKKARRFKVLIERLMTGYLENDYIQSYVDGSLDEWNKESVDSFNAAISSMKDSLASVGSLEDEAESVVEKGKSTFENVGNGDFSGAQKEDLKSEVEELKKQNIEILKKLGDVINIVMSGGVGIAHESEDAVDKAVQEEDKSPEIAQEASDDSQFDPDDPLFDAVSFDDDNEDESFSLFEDPEESEDDDFLDSLLEGQVYRA